MSLQMKPFGGAFSLFWESCFNCLINRSSRKNAASLMHCGRVQQFVASNPSWQTAAGMSSAGRKGSRNSSIPWTTSPTLQPTRKKKPEPEAKLSIDDNTVFCKKKQCQLRGCICQSCGTKNHISQLCGMKMGKWSRPTIHFNINVYRPKRIIM